MKTDSVFPKQRYNVVEFARHRLFVIFCTTLLLQAFLTAQGALHHPRTFNHPDHIRLTDSSVMLAKTMTDLRPVVKVVKGQQMREGAGVTITRTLGASGLRNLDPYLMLDELKCPAHQAAAGFPDHPHRGFETCSILLNGGIQHKDSAGNSGLIGPGGVQWMTAGRGIVHSEMPKMDGGDLHGFQLWINLPKKLKMVKPRYQDYQASHIPVVDDEGVSVRVMAGERNSTVGPIKMINPGLLMDVRLQGGATMKQPVTEGWNGFAYVYEGSGNIGGTKSGERELLVFGAGDHIQATAGNAGLKFLLVAGQPIDEPIVQYGPFVMNTQEEIRQAFLDYETGRLQNPDDNPWTDEL